MEVIVTQEEVDDLEEVGELFSTNLSPPPRVHSDPPFDDLQPRITDPLPLEVGDPPWHDAVSGDSTTEEEGEVTCLGGHSAMILPATSFPGLAPQGTRSPGPSGPQLSPTLPPFRPVPGELDFGRPEASDTTAPVDQDGRPLATSDRQTPPSSPSPDILPSPQPNSGASEHSGSHPLAARGRASTAGSEGSAPDESVLPIGAPPGPESRGLSQARDWTSPLDQEVNEPIVDGPDAERSQLIGQEFDDPIVDGSDAEQFHLIGRELRDPIVDDPDAERCHPIGREFPDPIDDSPDAEQPHAIGRDLLAIDPRPMGEPLVEALDGQGPESGQSPSPGEAVTDGCPAADSELPRDRGKVQVYFVVGLRTPAGVQEPDPARLPQLEAPPEQPPHSESRGEEGEGEAREEPEGEVPSGGLWKKDSFRRRSRSAPPTGSQVEGLGCAHLRRSNGETPRAPLQRQDAISIEGGQEEEEEEEEAGEDPGSATGEDDGRKPLGKSNSCPSPRSGPETPAQWMLMASRGQEQLVEKRPSREWHRRGIRRPSVAIPSSRDGSWDQPEECQSEDLQELGNTNNLEMRLSRRRSKILQSSRLLYQEYSHVALDQQLLRQKQEPPAPGGEASVEPVRRRVKVGDAPRTPSLLRASLSVPFVLWRDIPEVRRRREFECLSQEQQRLQEAKFELITSEASCLRSLDIAVEHFQQSPKLQTSLSGHERQWLFSKLTDVRGVSRRFLAHLEEDLEDDIMVFDVCGILLSHIPAFRAVYIPYVTNQSYQEKTFKRLIQNNPHFREAVEELESDPICQRLSLKSFLILPFQRITRLKLLVQNILKRSVPGSDEEQKASKAFEALEGLMTECNENVKRLRSVEALIILNQKIDFESKIFPLVSQSRRLIKDGQLSEIETGNVSLSKRKHTSRTIYLHLFNDCILVSRRKENGRFAVFDHAHSRHLVVEDFRVRGLNTARFLFQLTIMQNHQGNLKEFLLKANTQTEKLRWISALTPIQQEIDLTHHYDSKQVQCLKPYRAVENDELTLEKADILIVLQGGCDGWEEGCRLSDGDRGWFPTDHVESIPGRNARIRNIEERLQVRRMTDKLQSAASP